MTRGMLLGVVLVAAAMSAAAAETPPAPEEVVVTLKDGGRLVGLIVSEDETSLTVSTAAGTELRLPREAVASIRSKVALEGGEPTDPNETRLLLSPTGRPLRKGEGYFSDHYVLFPGFAYGFTDNLSLGAGMSVVPGLSLEEQLFYVSPRAGARFSDSVAVSLGVLYAGGWEDSTGVGLAYGVATFGKPARSLSVGVGYGGTREESYRGSSWRWSDGPILMLGGNVQLSRRVAFVTENWLILDGDFRLSEQPFSAALRLFGDRISADVGVVLVGDLLDDGLPIPWLSVSYHFGGSARTARRATTSGGPLPRRR